MDQGVSYWVAPERGALFYSASGLFAFSQAQLQPWEDTCTSQDRSDAVCYLFKVLQVSMRLYGRQQKPLSHLLGL